MKTAARRSVARALAAAAAAVCLCLPGCRAVDDRQDGHRDGMRYLALGDSYTAGEGVETAQRWPDQLAALLRARGAPVRGPAVLARTGWTTGELLAALERREPRGPFALVSLLIGVNNQFRQLSPDEYRREFRALLRRSVDLAGGRPGRVLVLSIPDWSAHPAIYGPGRRMISAQIDGFNFINREETRRAGARYVDITPASRKADGDPGLRAADGLHPSGRMYARWAGIALPAALAALERGEEGTPRGGGAPPAPPGVP